MRRVFLSLLFLSLTNASHSQAVSEVVAALQNLTRGPDMFRPEQLSEEAFASLSSLSNLDMFSQRRPRELVWPYWSLDCTACEAAGQLLIGLFRAGTPLWEVEVAVISLCIVLDLEAVEVCEGMVHNYGYQVEYILQKGEDITADLFCGVFVGGDCGDVGAINEWTVDIPELPLKPTGEIPDTPDASSPSLRVLQITDVHLDLSYTVGAPVDCGLPCCCLASTGLAGEGERAAGPWGDYGCDLPRRTFTAMMEHVAATHQDLDYVIYTGDAPAHDVWLQTKEKNLEHQMVVLDTLEELLPGVPVFLTLGNHEGFPVNAFPTGAEADSVVSGAWLYGGLAEQSWAQGLEQEARDTFSRNGFYSSLAKPGFRIIALNNNFCVGMNFFLMLDFSDPADQLAWLVQELLGAEERGEVVHVLMHHPPGSCLEGWAREYSRIVNRFQHTVKAQFHGHTHDDWFLVYHNETGAPSTTAFVAPSVTTYTDHNPEYRVYTIAGDPSLSSYGYVADHQTWSMDLSLLAGEESVPEWRQLYTAQEDLGLQGIGPQDWMKVLVDAATDDTLFEKMYRYYAQDRPGSLPDRANFLCRMVWGTECPF